jgi:CheY-like chemotaxis protein
MEGVLEVTSTPGEGSCFSFSIPLPAARQGEPQISSLASRRVLVVDDSEDNRLLIRAFLKGAVRSLDEAENGLEGVERFRAGHHDVVLMDMHMPEMDGIQATQAIREIENREYAPRALILALTADDSVNDRARSLAAGCDDHLVKPVSKKALLAALAGHTSAT